MSDTALTGPFSTNERIGRAVIADIAAAVGRHNYNWKREWAEKSQIERPCDRLPRGMKVALITKPYGLILDEMPYY